ncbi:hypothetical protein [Saccharopolyspora pogona]|nr:hypothetical protein [Saccharopolyspora pogona]
MRSTRPRRCASYWANAVRVESLRRIAQASATASSTLSEAPWPDVGDGGL